jgi:hypothetical protein
MTNITCRKTGEDGVSESIGFLLIFTMVIVGIGLVTLYGYPLLLQQQTSADEQIMEKNMIVLQNDMKSLAYKTVPYKETMLNIGGGSLTAYDSTITGPRFRIHDGGGTDFLPENRTGDLRYYSTSAGVDISLQNGAVVMRKLVEPGSTMLAQPRWFYDAPTETMVINVICLNSNGNISRSGIGTVQMELGDPDYAVFNGVNGVFVDYTYDSGQDYTNGWNNYLTNTMDMSCGGSQPLTCMFNKPISTLVIKKTNVIIKSI